MDVKHLERANAIALSMAKCREFMSFTGPVKGNGAIRLEKGEGFDRAVKDYALTPDAIDAAYRAMRKHYENEAARLRRLAAQIGLRLED